MHVEGHPLAGVSVGKLDFGIWIFPALRNTAAPMSQMLKSSGATAAATLLSRVLGLVREIVYANFMSTSWVAGAFALAFQIPNLFRRLLDEGAMWQAANAVISGLLVAASVIVAPPAKISKTRSGGWIVRLFLNGECTMRGRHLDALEGRDDFLFGKIGETGQQRLIGEVNDRATPSGDRTA